MNVDFCWPKSYFFCIVFFWDFNFVRDIIIFLIQVWLLLTLENFYCFLKDNKGITIIFCYLSLTFVDRKSYLWSHESFDFCWLYFRAKHAAAGMRYLERMKIIHRDIALRNMLVTDKDGKLLVKICDFGMRYICKLDNADHD